MRAIIAPVAMPPLPLTEAALVAQVAGASVGTRIEYHRGLLAADTASSEGNPLPAHERRELRRVAARAWRLAQAGLVHLVQRRHGDFDFAYLLEVRPRPLKLTAAQAKLLVAIPAPAMETDTPTEAPALAA